MDPDAPQRRHDLREVFNALRWIVRAGSARRMLPTNFPPWAAVHQQTQRRIGAGCFEAMVHDLQALVRTAEGRAPDPTAVVLDGHTLRSTPESAHRAGYDRHKRTKGNKVHAVVDTLGHLLVVRVTPADAQSARRWRTSRKPSRRPPDKRSSWPTSTRATPGRTPPSPPPTTASGWR